MARKRPDARAKRRGKRPDTRTTPQPGTITLIDQQFAAEWLRNGMNASQAYRHTHPNASEPTARVEGCRILAKPNVQDWLSGKLEPVLARMDMTAPKLVQEINKSVLADRTAHINQKTNTWLPLDQWPPELKAIVESTEFENGVLTKVKFVSKRAAMELGARYHGILQDRSVNINAELDLGSMTVDELRKRLAVLDKELERGETFD